MYTYIYIFKAVTQCTHGGVLHKSYNCIVYQTALSLTMYSIIYTSRIHKSIYMVILMCSNVCTCSLVSATI